MDENSVKMKFDMYGIQEFIARYLQIPIDKVRVWTENGEAYAEVEVSFDAEK